MFLHGCRPKIFFRIQNWLLSEDFDSFMLPMGELAYALLMKPTSEHSIEAEGILVREGIPIDFEADNKITKMPKFRQWSLIYEALYSMNPETDYKAIMAVSRDPLLMLHHLLQRHHDAQLDHLCCLAAKYPM